MPSLPALPADVDCLIVGGGPAGAALAGLLAQRGRLALLVDDGRARRAAALETLLPASLLPLDRCGLGEAVRRAAAPDRRRHGARWDTDELVFQPDGPRGLCLRRPQFDAQLRTWAAAQGALVVEGSVDGALPADGAGAVALRTGGGTATVRVRTCAVSTGRNSRGTLLPTQVLAAGPETASFALPIAAVDGGAAAVVEAVPDGWCWWIGDPDGGALAVVTVDGEELRRRGRAGLVGAVLAAVRGPGAAVPPPAAIAAVRATPRLQATPSRVLLLGDAAATLDPLASQGTEKALVGAEAAACAVDTALAEPALLPLALRHHARWERDLWHAHQLAAAGFYARVQRFAEQPFWARRRAGPAVAAPLPPRLRQHPDLRPEPVLHRQGDRLLAEPGFAVPGAEALSRVGRVAVAPVLAAFADARDVEDAITAAGQHPKLYVLGRAAVRAAVVELWRAGLLVTAAAAAQTAAQLRR